MESLVGVVERQHGVLGGGGGQNHCKDTHWRDSRMIIPSWEDHFEFGPDHVGLPDDEIKSGRPPTPAGFVSPPFYYHPVSVSRDHAYQPLTIRIPLLPSCVSVSLHRCWISHNDLSARVGGCRSVFMFARTVPQIRLRSLRKDPCNSSDASWDGLDPVVQDQFSFSTILRSRCFLGRWRDMEIVLNRMLGCSAVSLSR